MSTTYPELIAELRERRATAALGGPERSRQKHTERCKMLARDRVDALLDEGSPFLEVAPLAGFALYGETPRPPGWWPASGWWKAAR